MKKNRPAPKKQPARSSRHAEKVARTLVTALDDPLTTIERNSVLVTSALLGIDDESGPSGIAMTDGLRSALLDLIFQIEQAGDAIRSEAYARSEKGGA